jgi:periplasmic divalent cation tolerance protein
MVRPMSKAARLALCTAPDPATGERIAEALLGEGLAACVNIVPGLTSIYRWQGEVQRDAEVLLLIKTTAAAYPQLETRLLALHPYELPEILAVPIDNGLNGYLDWIEKSVKIP